MKKYVFCKLMLTFLMTATGCLEKTPEDGKTDNPSNPSPDPVPNPTAPTIAIASPSAGTATTSTILLEGTCSASVATVDIGGATPASTSCGTNGTFSVTITLAAPTGSKTVTVSQTNTNGTGSDSRSFMLNPEVPTVSINSPAANTITKNSINLQGSCDSSVSTVAISGASPASTTCSNGSFNEMVTLSGSDGSKTVTVSQTNSGGTGSNSRSFVLDATAPSPVSILINSGASYSNSTSATLTLSATDANEGIEMYITNISGCSGGGSWENFSSSKSWHLGQTNATATVYAKFRDAAGNESSCTSDTIVHDDQAPTFAQITAPNNGYSGEAACVTVGTLALCWGDNSYGQLGNNSTIGSSVPVQVSGLTGVVTSISNGLGYSCAILDGSAKCWGENSYGQLGNNSTTSSLTPVQVSSLSSGVTAISTGQKHTCAIVNGSVKCWGENNYGQLGDGSTINSLVPVQVSGLITGATAISVGQNYSCAVVSGRAKCWGYNVTGQLGNNSTANSSVPVQVSGLTMNVSSIATGTNSTCAVENGGARCWGHNAFGQLGNNTTTSSLTPVQVNGLTAGVTRISMHSLYACAVVNDGAKCWGYNNYGQLGNNSTTSSLVPVQVSGLTSGVTGVFAGVVSSCATTEDGVYCWGSNRSYQLGNGSAVDSLVPIPVVNLDRAISINNRTMITNLTSVNLSLFAYDAAQMYITNTGGCSSGGVYEAYSTSKLWTLGQTNGTATVYVKFKDVAGNESECMSDFILHDGAGPTGTSITIKNGNSSTATINVNLTLAATDATQMYVSNTGGCSSGGVYEAYSTSKAWTLAPAPDKTATVYVRFRDSLGNESGCISDSISVATPVAIDSRAMSCAIFSDGTIQCWGGTPSLVAGISTATKVSVGLTHTCVRLSDGTAKCWGVNGDGRLGNNSTLDSATPVDVVGNQYSDVNVGSVHSCALTTSGVVKCWGTNSDYQTGRFVYEQNPAYVTQKIPYDVANAPGVFSLLGRGGYGSCAIDPIGAVYCWGANNYGQLGSSCGLSMSQIISPVSGASNATSVSSSDFHSCATVAGGSVVCWGGNTQGQLGNVSGSPCRLGSSPVTVAGITTATSVSVGGANSCAILGDGTIKCWGELASESGASSIPQAVPNLVDVTHLSVGSTHACAISSDKVWCWGNNNNGELGNGSTTSSWTPVQVGPWE